LGRNRRSLLRSGGSRRPLGCALRRCTTGNDTVRVGEVNSTKAYITRHENSRCDVTGDSARGSVLNSHACTSREKLLLWDTRFVCGGNRKATFAARIDLDIALANEGICHLLRPLEGLGLQSLEVRPG
jgi:hypothetical protein